MQKSEQIFWSLAAIALLYLVMGAPLPGNRSVAEAQRPAAGSCHTGGGGCGCGGGAALP